MDDFEYWLLEMYREGRITRAEIQEILCDETRCLELWQVYIDGFSRPEKIEIVQNAIERIIH